MKITIKKNMSRSEFVDLVLKGVLSTDPNKSMYDRLIDMWPTEVSGSNNKKCSSTRMINDRKLFNDIYEFLSKNSSHEVDDVMRNWISNPYYISRFLVKEARFLEEIL